MAGKRCSNRCLAVVAALLGVLSLSVCSWVVGLWFVYDPLYTPMDCDLEGLEMVPTQTASNPFKRIADMFSDAGTTVTMKINLKCDNQNPYDVMVKRSQPSRVLIGTETQELFGHISFEPGQKFSAQRISMISTTFQIQLTRKKLGATMLTFLGSQVPFRIDFDMQFEIDVPLILGSVSFDSDFAQGCGFRMAGLADLFSGKQAGTVGVMVCADSLASLDVSQIPLVTSDGTSTPKMRPSIAMQDELDDAERSKDFFLSAMMGFTFGLGGILIATSGFLCCKMRGPNAKINVGGNGKPPMGENCACRVDQPDICRVKVVVVQPVNDCSDACDGQAVASETFNST